MRLAVRAQDCDPALGTLVNMLSRDPDEVRCRVAARRILHDAAVVEPRVRSVWTRDPELDTSPLSRQELASLASMPRPSELLLTPDVAPAPGIPPTSGEVEQVELDHDSRGRLHAHLPPGPGTLRLRHAGRESVYCLELRPCVTLDLTTHGDKLSRHPDVHTGPCSSAG